MSGYEKTRIVGMSDKDLDEFTCGICQEIFNDPVVTQCCRQTYCKACIEEWLTKQNTCPNDRKVLREIDLIQPPRFATNFLNNMQIKCEYEGKGCEVITTISELSKHMEECDHKPDITCKTCGLPKGETEDHNCVADLVIKNICIVDEMNRLRKEIQELKNLNQNSDLSMNAVIASARNFINDYFIGQYTTKITHAQMQFFIDESKEAIMNHDTFANISCSLSFKINGSRQHRGPKLWHVIAFSTKGGESWVLYERYFKIQFNKLVIEIFTGGEGHPSKYGIEAY